MKPKLGKKECDSRLSSYFPRWFDGKSGRCAWIPVEFEDNNGGHHEVVVISKLVVRVYCKNEFGMKNHTTEAAAYFDNFCENMLPDYSIEFSDDDFRKISLKTPFMAFREKEGSSPVCLRQSFKIVCSRAFKDLMATWRMIHPTRRRVEFFANHEPGTGQQYALLGGEGSTGKIPELSNYDMPFEEKIHVPAMEVPFWTELYTPMLIRFFDMPRRLKHVVHGVPSTKLVRCFGEVSAKVSENIEKAAAKKRKRGYEEA